MININQVIERSKKTVYWFLNLQRIADEITKENSSTDLY